MVDDPIATLERELVAAAQRRLETPALRRSVWGARLLAVAVVLVTLVVAGGALVLAGGRSARAPAGRAASTAAAVPGRAALIRVLGVLRRPQTAADLSLPGLLQRSIVRHLGVLDTSLVRRATVTPWGESVYLVPVAPGGGSIFRSRQETLSVLTLAGGAGGETARLVAARGALLSNGGRGFTHYVLVVPDGVSRVRFSLSGGLVAWSSVHGNVAAAGLARRCCTDPTVQWYGLARRLLRTFPAASL